MFFVITLVAVTSVLVTTQVGITDAVSKAWFSQYGDPGFARNASYGTDWGRMSKFRCALKCERSSSCSAFQYKKTTVSVGSCVFFSKLVFKNKLIALPGTQYYEKRNCAVSVQVDAAVQYRLDMYNILFSGNIVRIYQFLNNGVTITGIAVKGKEIISNVFPRYTTTVDAGVEMPFNNSTSITILLKGTTESCFTRQFPDFTFTSCGTSTYFREFFNLTGITKVDTMSVFDASEREIHVFAQSKVHHLRFDDGKNGFISQNSYDILAKVTGNPWYNTMLGITAMYRLTSRVHYLLYGDKYIMYDIGSSLYYDYPLIVC